MNVMRALAVATLFLTAAGCVAPGSSPCRDFPMNAMMHFEYAGSNASLLDEVRAEGWDVTPGENAFRFEAHRTWNGTRVDMRGNFDGLDPAGTVGASFTGPLGASTDAEARATLAPFVEPLASRLGAAAENVSYSAGVRHCRAA